MTVTDVGAGRWAELDPWDLSISDRGRRPLRAAAVWLSRRHNILVEVAIVVALYCVYDTSRGLVAGGAGVAVGHADLVNTIEHGLHINIEHTVQRLAGEVPGLLRLFGWGYTTLHLLATGAMLLWLNRTNAVAYVRLRTAVLAASLVALVGFVVWPTAPPRLAGIGIANTVSRVGINLDSRTLELLYNPYAAFPSLHEAYAVLVGYALWRYGRRSTLRALGVFYPVWVAVEVVATGNHFVLDVVAGAGVVVIGLVAARRIMAVAGRENERLAPQDVTDTMAA